MNGHLDVTMLAPSRIGLPYGVYPRLALMYLTTKALLTRERTFAVGESANDFLTTMGIKDSGGPMGASTRARNQLHRLTRTVFVYEDKRPAARPGDARRPEAQGGSVPAIHEWVKWPGRGLEVTLGESLYKMIRNGCLPLDAEIVAALRSSPMALDAYAWLTHRVARLKHATLVPWRPLEAQFGAEYKHPRQFRWMFRKSLQAVQQQWDGVEVEARERGVYLRPCLPSVQSWLERASARGGRPFSEGT